jgi:hypothetical protein
MKIGLLHRRCISVVVILIISQLTFLPDCQAAARTEVKIPNIPGYLVLKCDFHMHTVFSDGAVWPSIRAEEAWREGLDAFAIADHIEYQPHEEDVRTNHNRSYEIARPRAEALGLEIIKGAEISRDMPPGHFNAIFLKDANALDANEWPDAIRTAIEQKAFVFWNHPGWTGQQPEGKSIWYDEHTELFEKGWMHGIEIVNGNEYYPLAHKWALEKKLTMLGNSDVHNPTNLDYQFHESRHRTMTLVLAKEKSEAAIKEALLQRRTVVYWKNVLIGEEKYLTPIFNQSIDIINSDVTLKGKKAVYVQIHNKSEIDFELVAEGAADDILAPPNITLYGNKTVLFKIRAKSEELSGKKQVRLVYRIKNLLIAPEQGLREGLTINVEFVPAEKKKEP